MPRRNPTQTPRPRHANSGITVADLQPAPYNPRKMSASAARALEQSLTEFGDISGITWNKTTGHLVTGHQRLATLRQTYGDGLRMEVGDGIHGDTGWIITPHGTKYPVRIVEWDEATEKAANVAANSPYLSANFDEAQLQELLQGLEADSAALFSDLRLDELLADVAPPETAPPAPADQSYNRDGHASVTYSGPAEKVNEIKRLVAEKRTQIATATGQAPREVSTTEALYTLLTTPAPAQRRRR